MFPLGLGHVKVGTRLLNSLCRRCMGCLPAIVVWLAAADGYDAAVAVDDGLSNPAA